MKKNSNSFFIITSNNEKYLRKYKDEILETMNPYVLYEYNGKEFKTDQLHSLLNIVSMRNVDNKESVFVIEEFNKISENIQNKLLVTLENLTGKKSFIVTSEQKNGIIPTVISRSIIIEDSASSYTYHYDTEMLLSFTNSISKNSPRRFNDAFSENIRTMDSFKKLLSDLLEMMNNELIEENKISEIANLYETCLLANSVNIVKIKLMNILF